MSLPQNTFAPLQRTSHIEPSGKSENRGYDKSTEDLEVIWENTFYIYNGNKMGGFISKNMRSGDKLKTPAIISGTLFSIEIFPRELSEYSTLFGSTIYNPMKPGENGVLLAVKVAGKEITETITLQFSEK